MYAETGETRNFSDEEVAAMEEWALLEEWADGGFFEDVKAIHAELHKRGVQHQH